MLPAEIAMNLRNLELASRDMADHLRQKADGAPDVGERLAWHMAAATVTGQADVFLRLAGEIERL